MGVNEKLLKGKLVERPNEEALPVEELLKALAASIAIDELESQQKNEANNEQA